MVRSPINVHLLDGLSLAEVFERYVLNDPSVVSSAALVTQQDKTHTSVFSEGRYPGHYVEYAWPLDINPDDLAFQFVRPVAFFMDDPLPMVSKEILEVSTILVARIKEIKSLLTSGSVIARGTFAKTGLVSDVGRLEWARREIYIDVQNSDLLETNRREPVVKWSGLTLHLPATTTLKEQVIDTKPPAVGKRTAHRASIDAAIAALWPSGIPPSVTVQVRDGRINDWQKDNDQVVTSGKTIQRHLAKK
jgi:subtilisin family serine protease